MFKLEVLQLLQMVVRRMFSSLWMVVCLLVGSIIATALVSCIPIYTDGILQRMLTKDLENFQIKTGVFPGKYDVKAGFYYHFKPEDRLNAFLYFDKNIMSENIPEFDLPIIAISQSIKMGNLFLITGEQSADQKDNSISTQLGTLSGLEDHITITNGRLYSNKPVDDVFEVVVSQKAMKDLKLLLDKVYTIADPAKQDVPMCKVKVVGVFTVKELNDVYWTNGLDEHKRELLMDYKLFSTYFTSKGNELITDAKWNCSFDYHSITLQNLSHITSTYEAQKKWYTKYQSSMDLKMPAMDILKKYDERAKQLRTMLWVLTVPVLIMLIFYIFMVSQLIVKHDENSIAVLKSRGSSKNQIFFSYLIESSLVAAAAFIFGPPVGLFICRILGSSNGFLEFVQRTALPISLNLKVYGYSLATVVFLVITMLSPVIATSRTTIVLHKQGKAGRKKSPLWKKAFLDILLLLVSGYGIYRYQQQQKILEQTGVKASELQIDPLLFLASTIFILGAGLLFLRIYPYLIRFIYWVGKKIWSPVMYISLVQVGRSRGQEQFLMLFIILAISTGLFNANSARTINKNMEDRINYSIGADVRILAEWEDNQPDYAPGDSVLGAMDTQETSKEPLRYFEPDYRNFSTLSGTELATKVMSVSKGTIQSSSEWIKNIRIMGIVPNEFSKVAWFRPDLLPYHWYGYLNLLADAPKAFLVSSNLKEKYKLEEGDTIYISWGEQSYLEGRIYAFIDYWPTYNPNPGTNNSDDRGLVVANLSYIQSKLALQPYEVWIKKQDGATDKQINDDIIDRALGIAKIDYRNQELVKMKNDPMLQGINGMLTLCFITAMLISMLGFLIYWIISIQNRVLQFGILRAMGMSLSKVIGMLACEQVLVSGAAILIGIIIGGITGDTFIPLLQIVYSSAEQVPPFRIMAYAGDYIKIYMVIGSMLLLGFLILWRIISRIRIDQAVKLGED